MLIIGLIFAENKILDYFDDIQFSEICRNQPKDLQDSVYDKLMVMSDLEYLKMSVQVFLFFSFDKLTKFLTSIIISIVENTLQMNIDYFCSKIWLVEASLMTYVGYSVVELLIQISMRQLLSIANYRLDKVFLL